jgi:Protein of unknown function (DUF4197)
MKTIHVLSTVALLAVSCSRSENTAPVASIPGSKVVPATTAPKATNIAALAETKPIAATAPEPTVTTAIPPETQASPVPETKPLEVPPAAAKVDAPTNTPAKSPWASIGRVVGIATNVFVRTNAGATSSAIASAVALDLSSDQIIRGLKEALGRGLDHAIAQLGKDGGFLTNVNVRIPMPDKLQTVEKLLRQLGQDKLADEFIASMNHAAEKAVPVAAGVFGESLKQMSVEDARGILQGPNDAATQYFRRTAGPQLQEKFRPIIGNATTQAGATAAYKQLMDRVSVASPFLKKESLDLDDYVTTEASDGLFKMVAEEEKKIRQNPVERTTDLLRSVFGALGK